MKKLGAILHETCVVSSPKFMLYQVHKPLHETCVVSSMELMFYLLEKHDHREITIIQLNN